MARNLREVLTEYADKSGKMSKEAVKELISMEDLKKLTNEIACSVPFSYTEQQKLLEELDIKKRYEKLCSELTDEIQIIDVKKRFRKRSKNGWTGIRENISCGKNSKLSDRSWGGFRYF